MRVASPSLGHVLVVRTDHLGDMLLTTPMFAALKRADPGCRLTVLASAHGAPIARAHPDVDAVEVDPREAKGSGLWGTWALSRRLRALRCDVAIVVHPKPRLALAAWLARIPVRVGTGYRAFSLLFNRRVYEHRSRPPWRHESEYNLNLLRPLGIEPGPVETMRWRVAAADAAHVEALIGAARPTVVVHPGSSGSAMNWSPEQYIAVGKRLADHGVQVAVTGGAGETALTHTVAAGIGASALDLGGRLTLPQLAALLARSRLYVGGSTGPTHLAALIGTPVVALYPPLQSSSPVRWRPLGAHVRVLQPGVGQVCPTCLGERCPYFHCMHTRLGVDDVVQAALELLGEIAAVR